MDSTNFEDFNSPAGGVELSDTLSDWRLKTNGIIEKIDAIDSATLAGTSLGANAVSFAKIVQVTPKKLLGNTTGSNSNIAEVAIVEESGGIASNDVDTKIPSSAAVKDYVDNQFFDGQIVQQKTYRFDAVHSTGVVGTLNLQTSGTYNNKWLATGISPAPDILSAENFSRDGGSATLRNHGMAEVPVRTTITPRYASSLLCIEWHLTGEPNNYNSGFVIGRHRSDGKVEVINDTGYEGYNSSIQTQRNNYYSSMFYDRDEASTMKTTVVRYFIPAVNTNERTYTIIFADPNNNHSYVLNRTHTFSNGHEYEHGVSTATVQELYQV
tara:strand:- start:1040 stop:2014 length:975 start_codon:yes stop_codon:yes gene_type:complete